MIVARVEMQDGNCNIAICVGAASVSSCNHLGQLSSVRGVVYELIQVEMG